MTRDRHELEGIERPAREERQRDHGRHCRAHTLGVVTSRRQTYAAAGVSLATGEAVVERLRAAVESTGATGFGAFAGLHPLDERRLLAASTDSVGTKLVLARERGQLRACGADLAAHCINDVATTGADPLILLDYVAANRIEPEQVAELVEGAADVCREAGVALVGGETAELPGIYREEELDFAGTCVGIVERDRLVDGSRVAEGDVVVGFPSAGVHANGFSLVRRVLEEEDYRGDDLLAPTRCYLDEVRALRDTRPRVRARHGRRDRGQRLARRPGGPARARGLGRAGSGRPSSTGSHATSTRRSCGASSTSGSGTARFVRRSRATTSSSGGSSERDRRARLRRGHEPAGAARRGAPGRCRRVEHGRGAGARTRRARRRCDEGLSARRISRPTRLATPRSRTGSRRCGVDLVVCAGYMHLLEESFLERFPDRVVNVHPAPLPAFPGAHPLEDLLAAGATEAAATVHYVDGGVDTGVVIAAEPVPVLPDDTVESLRERVHEAEHRLLPEVVRELCAR